MFLFISLVVLWVKTLSTQSFISPLDECALNNIKWNVVRWIGFRKLLFHWNWTSLQLSSSSSSSSVSSSSPLSTMFGYFFLSSLTYFVRSQFFLSNNISATSTASFSFICRSFMLPVQIVLCFISFHGHLDSITMFCELVSKARLNCHYEEVQCSCVPNRNGNVNERILEITLRN